ncbi:MAG: hypothetical protein HKN50_10900 [Gammaproteobacteria bacterium]|nr:hypothetical protein [Gammaproteobacteria bacterium]
MRKTIVLIHLFLAAFVAPALLLVGISGGLYLLGVKGELQSSEIVLPADAVLDFESPELEADVRALLARVDSAAEFEYLRLRPGLVQTRPTSREYLEFALTDDGLALTRQVPDLQKSMIELHKGHGPLAFKTYQKAVAISLLFIVVSGVWLGITSPGLRRKTLLTSVIGLLLFVFLALA